MPLICTNVSCQCLPSIALPRMALVVTGCHLFFLQPRQKRKNRCRAGRKSRACAKACGGGRRATSSMPPAWTNWRGWKLWNEGDSKSSRCLGSAETVGDGKERLQRGDQLLDCYTAPAGWRLISARKLVLDHEAWRPTRPPVKRRRLMYPIPGTYFHPWLHPRRCET